MSRHMIKRWKPWDPTMISPKAWWDATGGTYLTKTNDSISQWSDKSGNNRHLIQDNGTIQPTYSNSSVVFNGVDQYLYSTSPFMYANGNISVFVVGAISPNVPDSRFLTESCTTDNDTFYGIAQQNTVDGTQMSVFVRNDAGGMLANHPVLSASGAMDDSKKLYCWADNGSNFIGNFNGGALMESAYTRTGVFTLDRLAMAAVVRATITWWLNCDINEVIVTDFADNETRILMEGWLAWKWGIQGSLPDSHLCKNAPPVIPWG